MLLLSYSSLLSFNVKLELFKSLAGDCSGSSPPSTMVLTMLNAIEPDPVTQALLSQHMHAFSDVDVIAGQVHFPSHRAVLAVHSLDFRSIFSTPPDPSQSHTTHPGLTVHPNPQQSTLPPPPAPSPIHLNSTTTTSAPQSSHPLCPAKYRVHIAIDNVSDHLVLAGWRLVHSYIYGASVTLTTDAVLAALPICRRYRFDELAAALDAYLVDGAVDPTNCTRVFAAAASAPKSPDRPRDHDSQLVQAAAWNIMKARFEHVHNWPIVPYPALVRLLKLNDLNVRSEKPVFDAVAEWLQANPSLADQDLAASLTKLIRFPTMTQPDLDTIANSSLLQTYPVCRKYLSRGFAARADESRGLVRNVVMESSPVYRRRRTDALTFSDRVTAWSRVDRTVHTSSRYFAGCLWNLVLEVDQQWVGIHLGCLSDADERETDVELDFSLFVVRHTGSDVPELVTKEVKRAGFGRSGQRIGFAHMIKREEVEAEGNRYLMRDTLFIGASLRLRSSKSEVIGISEDGDDTGESVSRIS